MNKILFHCVKTKMDFHIYNKIPAMNHVYLYIETNFTDWQINFKEFEYIGFLEYGESIVMNDIYILIFLDHVTNIRGDFHVVGIGKQFSSF